MSKSKHIRKKWDVESCRQLASEQGGQFLSDAYVTSKTHYTWMCAAGHVWRGDHDHVSQGKWCAVCAGTAKGSITNLRCLARSNNGKILSETYGSTKTKYVWQCENQHEWEARARAIQQGQWCPYCKVGRGESLTRACLEDILKCKLPAAYPSWLTIGRSRLQLDGYSEQFAIAFEYDGKHHYQSDHMFYGEIEALAIVQERDHRKDALCSTHNVSLLRIRQHSRLTETIIMSACLNAVRIAGLTLPLKTASKLSLPRTTDEYACR